jgi:quercetin dioxygenase-like cupin family protein
MNITIADAHNGPSLSVVGDTYRIVVSGDDTEGAYSVIDMLIPPGGGPPPHAHAKFQEAFYVMEGEIEVRTEAQKYTAKKGTFINIPFGGLVHQFRNMSTSVAHLLCIITPAGMEKMFEELGRPIQQGTFMPPPNMGPEQIQKFEAIAEKYGQKLYPPDFLAK